MATVEGVLKSAAEALYPRRKKRPTLYTPRHEAAARWKAFFVNSAEGFEEREHALAKVAALMGHMSDLTASIHYARPNTDDGAASFAHLVPEPDPKNVAAVKKRYAARRRRMLDTSNPTLTHIAKTAA